VGGGVEYAESMAAGVKALARSAKDGDVILTLGAGSVSQAGAMLLEALAGTADRHVERPPEN
jgi:UDP-N-acetylmuramate--alanine ligase